MRSTPRPLVPLENGGSDESNTWVPAQQCVRIVAEARALIESYDTATLARPAQSAERAFGRILHAVRERNHVRPGVSRSTSASLRHVESDYRRSQASLS